MNKFIKTYYITLLFFMFSINVINIPVFAGAVATAPVPSVHDMFKDVPQDELLNMMEEGQQFIKYLEENGTPEEKMAFAQAMEDTLQGFTEDDWKEFEQIIETVQDKLPSLAIEPTEVPIVETIKETPKKEEVKVIAVDNSLEKILHDIHKAINAILLKAKSDKILAERITINWDKKDDFNEMDRLLQTLNKKDHIIKLNTSKDEAIKTLLESIQNFNKRLQIENNQFIIADTFGLEIDKETTATNLKKLNKILEFFDTAIESLLPKLIKFMQEYEPEALKKAEAHDQSAKKALDTATKIEKQKRPIGSMNPYDKSPSNGSQKNNNQARPSHGYSPSGMGHASQPTPSYVEQAHQDNLKNIPQLKKSTDKGGAADKAGSTSDKDKKDSKKTSYTNAIDSLESYLDTNGNTEVGTYITAVNNAQNMYASFGTPIDEDTQARVAQLKEKRAINTQLQPEEENVLKKYEAVDKNFGKNTQKAHTYYADLKDSIENIVGQIDEMTQVIAAIKSNLDTMNSTELEKLNASPDMKKFGQRINSYHTTFKNVQHELRNKHKLHRLQRADYREERDYDDLVAKVNSLHGLDAKINSTKAQFESLQKTIKTAIARRKRDENKAASAR